MVADSRDLCDAARRFVRGNAAVFAASQEEADRILEEASKTGQTDDSKPAWQRKAGARSWAILRGRAALAHEALARLVEVYGEEEAPLLHEWVQHQFASLSSSRWQAWCVLLPTLAGVSDRRPPDVASPFAPEAWRRFSAFGISGHCTIQGSWVESPVPTSTFSKHGTSRGALRAS